MREFGSAAFPSDLRLNFLILINFARYKFCMEQSGKSLIIPVYDPYVDYLKTRQKIDVHLINFEKLPDVSW